MSNDDGSEATTEQGGRLVPPWEPRVALRDVEGREVVGSAQATGSRAVETTERAARHLEMLTVW